MTTTTDARALIPHLLNYQQADEEGIMYIASRQAVEEAAAALRDLAGAKERAEKAEARVRMLEAALAEVRPLVIGANYAQQRYPTAFMFLAAKSPARAALGDGGHE